MAMMGGGTIELGSNNSYSGGFTATMPLFAMPLYRGIQLGGVDRALAEEEIRGARVNLRGEVQTAFAGLLMARDSYRVMSESMRSAERTLENARRLASQGMVAEYDLIRAQVQVSNLQPAFVQAEQAVESAELLLKSLLNLPEEQAVLPLGTLADLASQLPTRSADSAGALTKNSQLRSLELQEEKLAYQLKMIEDTHLPTLSAVFNWQYMTQSNSFEFEKYKWVNTSMVGLQLNVPIFSGFTTVSKSQQMRIGQRAMALQRDYAAQQLEAKVSLTRNQMLAARESMEAGQAAIALSARGVEIARTRYAAGSGTLLELNDAEMAYTNAHLNYNKAVYAYIKAHVEYEKTLGEE